MIRLSLTAPRTVLTLTPPGQAVLKLETGGRVNVELAKYGPQGPPGPQGPAVPGPPGPPGPAGAEEYDPGDLTLWFDNRLI